jgi:catechol 2,3-dioxygenase-like lactoylglutathione lyase family enzyme
MRRNVTQITPFLHVPDFQAAIDFMTQILGFTVMVRMANLAYLDREGEGIRILCEPLQFVPGNRRYNVYIDCNDVDALYKELKPKLDLLPKRDVKGPIDRPYGMRELMILGPDGNYIVFAQPFDEVMMGETPQRATH